jgi:hypothetical protein
MGSLTMIRNEKSVLLAVTWMDDIQVECAGPEGVYAVKAALDYQHADARIILRRGPNEMILASGLGEKWSYSGRHALKDGDDVVLQWRAKTPATAAESEVAELTIEEVKEPFEADE